MSEAMRFRRDRYPLFAVVAAVLLALTTACGSTGHSSPAQPAATASVTAGTGPAFAGLETEYHAKLGVWALDTGDNRTVTWHSTTRIAYASTYKALAAAALLRNDSTAQLDRTVTYTSADLQSYAPITKQHVKTGMTVRALCDAAIRYSDNTAGNLLLRRLGGPAGLQSALRAIGDTTTHVDRYEPDLNDAVPGDVRDTSTPSALGEDLRQYAVATALPGDRRTELDQWLRGDTVGATLVRAGVPSGWTVGDKSGAGDYGTRNDIAVVWPPHRAPLIVVVMSTRTGSKDTYNDALIAKAAKVAVGALA
ncbi:class A beta-lactamase [Streptomyces sp. SL13]|jgi:beta-lactamase class A|uniref:Class A beta-lactamase n=1 Tax=Streptantibioticus silvisoli TaxID=2705255 RepID=A0AA90KGV2_9ACTN|nr:class A beta-lactamase [Streptantibioticus silvisoli]MDI5961224.1 class A beta-lactamase [Streptantibioticus silvisoli]MDI5971025.1 class A beta-lactamase [Streptantibioticus silvisoli]